MVEGSFSTAFPLKHMLKDLRLGLRMGDENGQALYTAGAADASYIKARNKGNGDDDFSSVFRIIKEYLFCSAYKLIKLYSFEDKRNARESLIKSSGLCADIGFKKEICADFRVPQYGKHIKQIQL